MQARNNWAILVLVGFFGLTAIWSGGCDPRPVPITPDGTTKGEHGSEHATADGTKPDAAVGSDSNTSDTGTTDTGGSDTGTTDTGTTDEGGTDTSTSDTTTTDQSNPDTGTTDTVTTDNGTTDSGTGTECADRFGYCLSAGDTDCRKGYTAVNNPLGCGKPVPTCCLPDAPPKCGQEGDTVSLNEVCCPGLTGGSIGTPPNCGSLGQKFICVKCGDGTCDSAKGENSCSCPKDCPTSSNACVKSGGICTSSVQPCQPGYTINPKLGCGANKQQCCVKQAAGLCKTDKDCPQTCSGSGVCTITTYKCTNNKCVGDKKLSQPNAKCDSSTGQCVQLTPTCKTNCDCNQGLVCVPSPSGSQCIAGTKPEYCCDKAGCPAGSACTTSNGTKSTCPAANNCTAKGGYCVTQFTKCRVGYTLDSKTSCGAILSKQCCVPVKNPCALIRCKGPTCATANGSCTETTYTCNPKTGKCEAAAKKTGTTCTTPRGGGCTLSTPYCSNNQCATRTSASPPSCSQVGTTCVQKIASCSNNQCKSTSTKMANQTCGSDGRCAPKSSTCSSHCDCTQGLLCANGCRAGVVAMYCCDNKGCPTGRTCSFRNGNRGTCP